MPGRSVFADEWRDCLQAHFSYVIHNQDKVTERTLRGVLREVGFNEDELAALIIDATAHVEDVRADFMPDLDLLERLALVEPETQIVPIEMAVKTIAPEVDNQPPDDADDPSPDETPAENDTFVQLSMF